jgi:tRNA modification GTPase
MKPSDADPIVAIATAPGRGGIGIVRVSGRSLERLVMRLWGRLLEPRRATLRPVCDAEGARLDMALVLYFPAPHSYTGEDVLELQVHGGPVLLQLIVQRVIQAGSEWGLRLAEPGEFTRRAFLHDKLDLAQAEAVADLIESSTEQAVRSASRSLAGVFSKAVHDIVAKLIELRMLVEATLDFPEEELDVLQRTDAVGRLAALSEALDHLLKQARHGALLRDGLHVVLVGAPNVGKSSLLNALAGAEVAIVTPVPGTTRDRIVQPLSIEGVPLVVVDTAGLRETNDLVERLGIDRTVQEIAQADVIVHLGVASSEDCDAMDAQKMVDEAMDARVLARLPSGIPIVRVWNKIDACDRRPEERDGAVWLSARTGEGLSLLRSALLRQAGGQTAGEGLFMARERHVLALREASIHLQHAAVCTVQSLDLMAEELRLAQEQLNTITGEFGADDLLGVIFSRFCIGK